MGRLRKLRALRRYRWMDRTLARWAPSSAGFELACKSPAPRDRVNAAINACLHETNPNDDDPISKWHLGSTDTILAFFVCVQKKLNAGWPSVMFPYDDGLANGCIGVNLSRLRIVIYNESYV